MMQCDVVNNPFPPPPSPPPPFCAAAIPPPQRNPADCCFRCGKEGHWARECPNKLHPSSPGSNSSSPSSSSNDTCDLLIRCCSGGTCHIRTSRTVRNPNRRFYACPGDKSGGKCGFFKFCDELNFRAPICGCKAGFCSLNGESSGPNQGKWYFACRVKKSQGACDFIQWVDYEVNTIMNTRGRSSLQSLTNSASNDLDKKEVSSEIESPVIIVSKEQDEVSSCRDLVMQEAESWNPITEKILKIVDLNPMFQSESHCLKESRRQISAAGTTITADFIHQILGLRVYGWLGRLAFPPSQCPKDAPVMPIFCCIFPSFDPVTISEDVDMADIQQSFLLLQGATNAETDIPLSASDAETDIPLSRTPEQDAQLLDNVFEEPLGLEDPFGIIQNDNVILKSILKTFGQALLNILESMNPPNHEVMVAVAEATFNNLKSMSIQCDSFVESVKKYIENVSRVTLIQESMPKGLSSKELAKLYDNKKMQFNNISRCHADAVAAYRTSNSRLQSLNEEVSHVKSTLLQLEKQLIACESETSALKTHADEVSKDMLEAKRSMEDASKDMLEALDLEHEREAMLDAARAALETARVWI